MTVRVSLVFVMLALGVPLAPGAARAELALRAVRTDITHGEGGQAGTAKTGTADHGRPDVGTRRALKPTPALRGTTQRVARHRARHHLHHHRYATGRSELADRSAANEIPPSAPARPRTPPPARVPVSHQLRDHDGGGRSSPRNAVTATWVEPAGLLPLRTALSEVFLAVDRVELWRNAGRGPPRAGPRGNPLPSASAQRPLGSFPGARPRTRPTFSIPHETLAFRPRLGVPDAGVPANRSIIAACERVAFATRHGISSVPHECLLEARHELHCVPAEGPAADRPTPSSSGGSS